MRSWLSPGTPRALSPRSGCAPGTIAHVPGCLEYTMNQLTTLPECSRELSRVWHYLFHSMTSGESGRLTESKVDFADDPLLSCPPSYTPTDGEGRPLHPRNSTSAWPVYSEGPKAGGQAPEKRQAPPRARRNTALYSTRCTSAIQAEATHACATEFVRRAATNAWLQPSVERVHPPIL